MLRHGRRILWLSSLLALAALSGWIAALLARRSSESPPEQRPNEMVETVHSLLELEELIDNGEPESVPLKNAARLLQQRGKHLPAHLSAAVVTILSVRAGGRINPRPDNEREPSEA